MRQKIRCAVEACTATGRYSFTKVLGIPIDDDGGEQVQPCHPEMLPLGCPVANFALATSAQGIREGVVGLAFVEANLGTALPVTLYRPVDPNDYLRDYGKRVLMA